MASGEEQREGAILNPASEMGYSKSTEMFAEAIPGFVIQAIALLMSGDRSFIAISSIFISSMTTALTATSTFYGELTYDRVISSRSTNSSFFVFWGD